MRLVRMAAVAVALALGMAIGGGDTARATNGCAETHAYIDSYLSQYDDAITSANALWDPAWEEEQPPIEDPVFQLYHLYVQLANIHYNYAQMWIDVWYENNCHLM